MPDRYLLIIYITKSFTILLIFTDNVNSTNRHWHKSVDQRALYNPAYVQQCCESPVHPEQVPEAEVSTEPQEILPFYPNPDFVFL